jgi:hypothetical protein
MSNRNHTVAFVSILQLILMCASGFSQWTVMNHAGLAGTDGKINVMAYHGGMLYVGGEFTIAGTGYAKNVAKWDGKQWAPVGEGFNGPVDALCCDANGILYAAVTPPTQEKVTLAELRMRFRSTLAANGSVVYRWDGKEWQTIGKVNTGTVNGYGEPLGGCIKSMVCDSKNRLVVSGEFYTIDSCKAMGIAAWDGQAWRPLDDGRRIFPKFLNPTYGLFPGENDVMYAINEKWIGCWDGSAWSLVGKELNGEPVGLALDGKGRLVAGGQFKSPQENNVPLAIYTNGVWEYPGIKVSTRVTAIGVDAKGTLHIGTNSSVYAVDKNELRVLGGPEFENQLQGAAGVMMFDPNGNLYAAGYGLDIGGKQPSVTILQWNGARWRRMPGKADQAAVPSTTPPARHVLPKNLPLPDTLKSHQITAFTSTPDGQVFISGNFNVPAGREFLCRLARWDGNTWRAVGPGLPSTAAVMAADPFGNLYAAGQFPTGGWNEYHRLMHWDGTSWQAIKYVPEGITALACDASGFLYIGTAAPSKGSWEKSLCKWDDSIVTVVKGAPAGSFPNFARHGAITRLDVIGSVLHVQGDFTAVGGLISPGYATCRLDAPDTARIRAKREAMQRNARQTVEHGGVTVFLEESYGHLGTKRVVRFEKMVVSNQTTGVIDTAVLFTPDSTGFIYDNTEKKWGHITQHPVITAAAAGFRFAFPLGKPLLPGQKRPLWISKSQSGRVVPAEPDSWIYKDTLQTLFANVSIPSNPNNRPPFTLSIPEDSFTVIQGGSVGNEQYTMVEGKPGTAFNVRFAVKPDSDPVCGAVMSYVSNVKLIDAYTPMPRELLPNVQKLSRVKQALLARELIEWCFSFGHPLRSGDLWDLIGEGDGTVPEAKELRKRFGEISQFYLEVLKIVAPNVEKETYQTVTEKIRNWHLPECGSEANPLPADRWEGDIVYCSGSSEGQPPEIEFYPMELIKKTLKILGPAALNNLETFEAFFSNR